MNKEKCPSCNMEVSETKKSIWYMGKLLHRKCFDKNKKEITKGDRLYRALYRNYVDMMDLGKKFTAGEVIEYSINHIKAELDMIKFSLIEQYKNPADYVLEDRTEPSLCIDMYMRSIRRHLVVIENLFEQRAREIRKIRGEKTR